MAHLKGSRRDWWAIILAGGDGLRLRTLTRRITGEDVPKQFCHILGSRTLLEQTRDRIYSLLPASRIIVVLNSLHRRFYTPILADTPDNQMVVQPANKGTAAAILYAMMKLLKRAPEASVVVLPSDHYIGSDSLLTDYLATALEMSELDSAHLTLFGVVPSEPEVSYGWIEPGDPVISVRGLTFHAVKKFWEKPSAEVARRLWEAGFLWNSFIMVGRALTFVELIRDNLPHLFNEFVRISTSLDTDDENAALQDLYARLVTADFSSDVLAKAVQRLTVLPLEGVAWSDLGEPARVLELLNREGIQVNWAQI